MRRLFHSVVTVIIVTMLAGCGERKLICSTEEVGDTGKVTMSIEGHLKGINVVGVTSKMVMTFADDNTAIEALKLLEEDPDMIYTRKGKIITGSKYDELEEPMAKEQFKSDSRAEGLICE